MINTNLEIAAYAESIAYSPCITPTMRMYAEKMEPYPTDQKIKNMFHCRFQFARLLNRDFLKTHSDLAILAISEMIEETEAKLSGVHSRSFDSPGSGCSTHYQTDSGLLDLIQRKDELYKWIQIVQKAAEIIDNF